MPSLPHRRPQLPGVLPLLTVLLLVASCAAPELERLEDEPPSADVFTLAQSRRTHPAVDGCQRFMVAVRDGHFENAYRQLSMDTRKALALRAQVAGWSGEDVLRLGKIPVRRPISDGGEAGPAETAPFDAEGTFALRAVQTLQLLATPSTGTSVVEQRLRLKSGDGHTREVTMRFEGLAWRIHNPELTGLPAQ